VAYPCLDIEADPLKAFDYTSRGNLVAVITNGTAVLGLGNIGPLASKPVMEGKGCLFKKFAGVDVFDIELAETDPDKLVEIIAALEPTLGGINLEDIKAPECFYIEQKLSARMNIPVFHDDQHGTAIISSAALLNGLELVGKDIGAVKIAVSGAGAAAIACVEVIGLGVKRENVFMVDSKGVIYEGRPGGLDASKQRYAIKTEARTLADVVNGADVFLGCSAPGVLTADMVKTMADKPIILALANPEPEIRPELAKAVRPDCIIATGRSDYPNQVNNVLCFPYIFRGALDCGATKITEAMKLACVREIADLAKAETSAEVAPPTRQGTGVRPRLPDPDALRFAPDPQDRPGRGQGRRRVRRGHPPHHRHRRLPRADPLRLPDRHVHAPVFNTAKRAPQRVVYAEGEDERVLRAVQFVADEGLAAPILIGRPPRSKPASRRPACASSRARTCRSSIRPPMPRGRLRRPLPGWQRSRRARQRQPAGRADGQAGDADAMLCGLDGNYDGHLAHVEKVIGLKDGAQEFAALNAVLLDQTLFITDTYVNDTPDAEQLAASPRPPPKKWRASACRPRWPSCRTPTTAAPRARRPARWRRRTSTSSWRRRSSPPVNCTATPPCRRRCATASAWPTAA
jgi:malate dehydrogenase (oxaloacetate-decarboxylating)(NADP+)